MRAKEKQDFELGKNISEKKRHDEYLEYKGGKQRSFYLPKGKLKERVEDPLFKTPYTFLETEETLPDRTLTWDPLNKRFKDKIDWERYGLTGEEGIKEKWETIYDMGGMNLMDRIGIAGGVANMAEGGIMSLKKKW
jgi:hypothetical protein